MSDRLSELNRLRQSNTRLRKGIEKRDARIKELELRVKTLESQLRDVMSQLQEMKTIIFKKKRPVRDEEDTPKSPPKPHTYTRPIPTDAEVTVTKHHTLPRTYLRTRTRVFFVEDIPLNTGKIVTRHIVEQGWDPLTNRWVSATPLPPGSVILGDNVRVLVATLITIERLSYTQVQTLIHLLFKIHISSGEIANILHAEAEKLAPAADALLERIRKESSQHMDETTYRILGDTGYAWGMTGGTSNDTYYRLGVSRGKGHAEDLLGDSTGTLVTDDYGAYRKLRENHQLCFAHLIRKFRDLAAHEHFTETERAALMTTYVDIKAFYEATKTACSTTDPEKQRTKLVAQITRTAQIVPTDPKPAVRLKTTLQRNISKYLTCLSFPTIDLTNNRAERALRHLVLKRKTSFGCRSEKGARTLSILMSVLLSLYRKEPGTYLENYVRMRGV
jgi:Transposase IS66 family